ncbi:MAG TPA: phosphoglycerate kinase [Candidatus Paceibacterota bacterium]
MKSIEEAKLSPGQRVLLRLDLNVPCKGGRVENDYRIRRSLPTLEYLEKCGCRTVILSHLNPGSGESLSPVYHYLKTRFSVSFASTLDSAHELSGSLQNGAFILVEDIRREKGEKENDEGFSKRLTSLADVFVNDAFGVSHRKHSSIVGVPKFLPSFAGFLLQEEIQGLTPALHPPKGSLFVLGGAKFETKLPLLLKFLDRYERVFVGGALANDIFHAMGLEVGTSLVSTIAPNLSTIINRPNLRIPLDVLVQREGEEHALEPEKVKMSDRIVDAGLKTVMLLEQFVSESSFVLWNGPLGVYQEGFVVGTHQFAKAMIRSKAISVVGGGDTIAAIEDLGLMEKFGFISTGGGAMLDFLANETLPGIEVLKK